MICHQGKEVLLASVSCVDSFGEYHPGGSFSRVAKIDNHALSIFIADPANVTHVIVTQSGRAVFKANYSPATGLRIQKFSAGPWTKIIQATAHCFPPSQQWTFGQEALHAIQ